MDALLAASKVGDTGKVVGIDISEKEVHAATDRAAAKGVRNVEFLALDMENLPFREDSYDCVISNGW